jgi:predicted DNA binding CopG/RHH family protein
MENKKTLINIRIENETIELYKEHCLKHGYSLSKRIRTLIQKDLENGVPL